MADDKYSNLASADAEEDIAVLDEYINAAHAAHNAALTLDRVLTDGHIFADYDGDLSDELGEARSQVSGLTDLAREVVGALEALAATVDEARRQVADREVNEEMDELDGEVE